MKELLEIETSVDISTQATAKGKSPTAVKTEYLPQTHSGMSYET